MQRRVMGVRELERLQSRAKPYLIIRDGHPTLR